MSTVTTPAPPTEKAPRPKGRTQGVGRLAAWLVSPTFLVLGLVVGYPLIAAVGLSFFKESEAVNPETGLIEGGSKFAGLANYAEMFTGTNGSRFLNALWNTTFFTLATVLLETAIAASSGRASSSRGRSPPPSPACSGTSPSRPTASSTRSSSQATRSCGPPTSGRPRSR
jgi:ABC-type Fe3+ transport system permease subunit